MKRSTLSTGMLTAKNRAQIYAALRICLLLCVLPLVYGAPGCTPGGGGSEEFEQAWGDFDRDYSYFIHKNVDWNAVKAQYQNQFSPNMSADAFAEKFNNMLQVLHDWHVWVQKPGGEYLGYNGSISANYTSSPRNRYAPNGYEELGDGVIRHGIVGENGENIAYIRIDTLVTSSFQSISEQDIENLFARYATADGMIIDIRANSGGNEAYAIQFASRFTEAPLLYGKVAYRNGSGHGDFDAPIEKTLEPSAGTHFTGPAVCLIGQRVMSSGEWFTLMMRACPRVTLIGDRTRGASGGPAEYSLSNGVNYSISRWVAYTDDDVAFEDHGIAPDIAIPANQSFDGEHDYVLERAIELIKGGGATTTTTTVPSGTTTTTSAPPGTTTTTSTPSGSTPGAPVIDSVTVDPAIGNSGTLFVFTCNAHDTDGGSVDVYYWDFPGEFGDDFTIFYNSISRMGFELGLGSHTVWVQVEDDDGKRSDVRSVTVQVQ